MILENKKNRKNGLNLCFVNRDNSNGLSLSTNAKYALSNGLFQTLFGRFQTELQVKKSVELFKV